MRKYSDLRPDQHESILFSWLQMRATVALDVGFGKTIVELTTLGERFRRGMSRRCLVISTKAIAQDTWQEEALEWEHTEWLFPHMRSLVGLTAAQRKHAMFGDGWSQSHIDTINLEHIQWIEEQLEEMQRPLGFYYDCVIFDEVSKLKNPKGKRFKSLARMLLHVPRFHGLSGSLAAEGYHEIWAPTFLCDYGHRLMRSYDQFEGTHFEYNELSGKRRLREGHATIIEQAIADITRVLSAEELEVLPPVMYVPHEFNLSPSVQAKYEEFERELYLVLADGGTVAAAQAGAKTIKCLQLTSGSAYVEDALGNPSGVVQPFHTEKLAMLFKLAQSLGENQNLLISTKFRHEYDRIAGWLNQLGTVEYMNSANAAEMKKRWNAGEIRFLVTHPASCGHGLNLQRGGSDVCFFTLPHSREEFEQVVGRLRRPGQGGTVRVHALTARGTVDMDAWGAQLGKYNVQQAFKSRVMAKYQQRAVA